MGGEATGCSDATTDVLIESALWDNIDIALTGRKLGISSDARYRFERGSKSDCTIPGLELATQMVLELSGGTPSEIAVAVPAADRVIDFPLDALQRLAGLDASPTEVTQVLPRLGFAVRRRRKPEGGVAVVAADVHGKADIVEELVRILGVGRVPLTPFERGESGRSAVLRRSSAHAQGQARARRARAGRSGDLVVRRQEGGGAVRRRRGSDRARQPSQRNSRTCGRALSRAGRRGATQRRSRLCRRDAVRGRSDFPRRPAGISSLRRAACGALARPIELGRHRLTGATSAMRSMSKPTRSPCSLPRARRCRRSRSCPEGPGWLHPGRSEQCRSGRRTCSAISASCIRARSMRSMPRDRSSPSS